MKLELKHLAGYLPYGLKIEHPTMLAGKRKISELRNLGQTNIEISHRLYVQISNCKPILHPLSEINPSQILLKHYFNKEKAGIEKELQMIRDGKYDVLQCSYNICNILISEHFDIHDLINNGLAIDINTL